MKTIFSDPTLCTPLCIFLVSWLGGRGGGVEVGMYDSKCDHDRKVIPKKTQIGPLIMLAQDQLTMLLTITNGSVLFIS